MPYRSPHAQSLADLILRQGEIAAARAQQRGDLWGTAIRGVAGIPAQMQQRKAAERAAQLEEAQIASRLATDAMQRRNTQSQMDERGNQRMDEQAAKDLALSTQKVSQWLGEIASAPDLESQRMAYKLGRDALVKEGRLTPDDAPPFFPGASWVKARMAQLLPVAERFKQLYPEPKAPIEVSPGATLYDQTRGAAVFTAPKPDERAPNPTEASLAAAAAAGDKQAAEALRLLRTQRESGQQDRGGYFTMSPVYDAQGRPVGAIKLNARTGETSFVQPGEMGGVTARPPGNLGQRTVENEAALDALGRLKTMFDAGASADIGPAEGRARRTAQGMPGGVTMMEWLGQDTKRFADFEAGTRAFQNAMIKAITGAQMSEPEAKRIMGQIPTITDHPTVWQAKYTQSVKNLEDLERRVRQDRGAPADDRGGDEFDFDPATGQLVPRRGPR